MELSKSEIREVGRDRFLKHWWKRIVLSMLGVVGGSVVGVLAADSGWFVVPLIAWLVWYVVLLRKAERYAEQFVAEHYINNE